MGADEIHFIEKFLISLGITHYEIDAAIFVILGAVGFFAYRSFTKFRLKCSSISCDEIKRFFISSPGSISSINDIKEKVTAIEMSVSSSTAVTKDSLNRLERDVSDIKTKTHDINTVLFSSGEFKKTNRIIHED